VPTEIALNRGFFTASTLALSGTQQAPRSGILLLLVRSEQPVGRSRYAEWNPSQ
jgi:hypothetical protein